MTADQSRCPVTDWMHDLDHADPAYNPNAHAIWDTLREQCPMPRSERYGGLWTPLTDEFVRQIAYDPALFSSIGAVVNAVESAEPPPFGAAPPITSDPPVHAPLKRLLLPAFAPQRVVTLEPAIRATCRALIEPVAARGPGTRFDAASEYAQHVPMRVMFSLLGVPSTDTMVLQRFIHELLEGVARTEAEQHATRREVDAYLDGLIAVHRAGDGGSLIRELLDATIDGVPLADRHVRGIVLLLLLAGIDTTWSAIGAALHYFAQHPQAVGQLRDDPTLWPTAVEELLRAFAPVTMGRTVTRDTDWNGHALRKGDRVLLAFPAANRDPARFSDASQVVLTRAINPHVAFGLGIHRCIGAHLARLELRVALEEFLRAIPHFDLPDPGAVRWSVGQVRGPRVLPLRMIAP